MKWLKKLFGKEEQPIVDINVLNKAEEEPKAQPRSVRSMVYREAFVVYESGYRRKGVVLDHTEEGVRLRFPTNERLPDAIVLNAKSVGLHGPAKVVWQKGSEAGLQLSAA